MIRIGFIVEQALGHITHGKNLQALVPQDKEIDPYWGFPAWETNGIAGKIPLFNSNWTVRAGLRARRLLRHMSQKADLDGLFFHTQVPAILATDWLKKLPSVVSLDATPLQYDSLGEFYDHQASPSWLERAKYKLNQDCYHAARHLVTWSAWAKQGLIDDYDVPASKITVIPPGVHSAAWLNPNGAAEKSPATVKILFVGGDLQRKGGALLLEAVRALRQQKLVAVNGATQPVEVELHLVTREKAPAEAGVKVYNDMQPNSPELKELYHSCHIFCLPTYGDCLPMALSEAGAAGMPSVSTDIAGIPEIVRPGETGFLIPPGDAGALTRALRQLVEDPSLRQRQGRQAVELVAAQFDAEKNTRQLLSIIKNIILNEESSSGENS